MSIVLVAQIQFARCLHPRLLAGGGQAGTHVQSMCERASRPCSCSLQRRGPGYSPGKGVEGVDPGLGLGWGWGWASTEGKA